MIVYADSLIPTVRRALTDTLPEVRAAAANTFNSLHANIGSRALDEILPALLEKLVSRLDEKFWISFQPFVIRAPHRLDVKKKTTLALL